MLNIETLAACPGHRAFRRATLKIGRYTVSLNPWTLAIQRGQTARTRHVLLVLGWGMAQQPGLRPSASLAVWETGGETLPVLRYDATCYSVRRMPIGRRILRAGFVASA